MQKVFFFVFGLLAMLGNCAVRAAEPDYKDRGKNVVSEFPFEKHVWEVQLLSGAYFGIEQTSEERPNIDDVDLNLRFGVMLSNVRGSGFLRGNYEMLLEIFGASIIEGPGNAVAGGTVLLRYNFVQAGARFVPYLQIGAGGLYNDVYREHVQRLLGSGFEFNLQSSLGLRWMLTGKWSLAIEGGYRHISNANTAARNLGLNSLGGLLGVGYFF